ncbi:MAG: hypothetical protein ABIQ39_03655 [Ilumatobacteraceae bacterium]
MSTPLEADREASRQLVAGTLLGLLGQYARDPDKGVLIERVEPKTDEHGNICPWMVVHMASGTQLLVAVSVLE